MESKTFSPKIEIINYFDKLINQVDIEIDETVNYYNENQILADLNYSEIEERKQKRPNNRFLKKSPEQNDDNVDLWSESTKVVDYLNQVRMRTIESLRKAQEETLDYYKLNKSRINDVINLNDKIELIYAEKCCFQIRLTKEPFIFNLFTCFTDFYMSISDILILEKFINNDKTEVKRFFNDFQLFFDEKMVLIDLICEQIFDHLTLVKYPNNLISVSRKSTVNIREIELPFLVRRVKLNGYQIDLSNLESLSLLDIDGYFGAIELDGLFSLKFLKLNLGIVRQISMRNLLSLSRLVLLSKKPTNSLPMKMFGSLSSIRELEIRGNFSDINLNELINLESFTISGFITDNFNFDLFEVISSRLRELSVNLRNIDAESVSRLFDVNFTNLVKLDVKLSNMRKLEKKMFVGFEKLQSLSITKNKSILQIDYDSFSSLNSLTHLDLSMNCIETINKRQFSGLRNLQRLNLSHNRIGFIEENSFIDLKSLTNLDLSSNQLSVLNPKSFIGLENLKRMSLKNCKLIDFDLGILDCIPKIGSINLACNCFSRNDELSRRFKRIKVRF